LLQEKAGPAEGGLDDWTATCRPQITFAHGGRKEQLFPVLLPSSRLSRRTVKRPFRQP
jgi:hypothetical protein